VARIYDYMLGGKDNLAADRRLAEELLAARATDMYRSASSQLATRSATQGE
jgi:S-adenosyl methyltransferase